MALQLGESTLALDEEMLQVLDAVDRVKRGTQSTYLPYLPENIPDQQGQKSFAALVRPRKPSGEPKHTANCFQVKEQSGGGKRAGWKADCKDLVQRLLFSEDSEEAQENRETSASTKKECCQETSVSLKVGTSSK